MCWQDIEIGRKTHSSLNSKTLANATNEQVVAESRDRTSLIFNPPAAGTVWLNPSGEAAAGVGIPLTAATGPLVLHVGQHSDLSMRTWNAFATTGTPLLSWIEGILTDDRSDTTPHPQ